MQCMAQKQLRRSVVILLIEYFVVFSASFFLVQRTHPVGAMLVFFALLPVIPLVMMFVQFGRYLRDESDEYKRAMLIRCVLWGTAGAMTVHLASTFLRLFEWKGELPPFSELFTFAAFMLIAKFSYRVADRVPADA